MKVRAHMINFIPPNKDIADITQLKSDGTLAKVRTRGYMNLLMLATKTMDAMSYC